MTYEIFRDDISGIKFGLKIQKTLYRQLNECEFYEFGRKKNIKKQVEREKDIINNRKLNLFKKIGVLSFEDFVKIIESAEMIRNYYFVIDGNDVLVTVDQENKKCIAVMCDEKDIEQDIWQLYNDSDIYLVTRELGETIYLNEIKSIDRRKYLQNLINYDNGEVFESFIDSFITIISENLET